MGILVGAMGEDAADGAGDLFGGGFYKDGAAAVPGRP